ncbi:estrogen receptor [Elysia marginata]|uniref:Estrogen receptor n=1 Tax=Elysia marginata TaxID=1093978 RepID=A0AAV4FZU6_9GAST|nr:estrogen receptor [Elysia marginata]
MSKTGKGAKLSPAAASLFACPVSHHGYYKSDDISIPLVIDTCAGVSPVSTLQDLRPVLEPSDCKSPKEEGRMVSPSSCMPVLPIGSGGGSSGGGDGGSSAAHLQAATSTTPEAGAGPGPPLQPPLHPPPPHFLLDPHVALGGSGGGGGDSSSGQAGSMGVSQPIMKQEVGGAVPGSSMQARVCQVCRDNASGFHYGVWSCEGCKAFFKRSIQGPVDYICPATNTCTIDKHRRKSCQACRLRRCYEVGMNKGSQRKERKNSNAVNVLKGKRCRADSSDAAVNSTNNGGAPQSKAARRSRSASILEALQRQDLPVIESHHNHNEPATRVHLLNTLVQLADKELIYLINWAKNVPGYSELIMGDQVHLIENCWLELLWLNCAFRSMEHNGRTLVFAPDFHLDRQQWELTGMGDVLEQVSAVSEQMVHHGLNKEELLLLQATVLVNAEVRRLGSFEKIQEMRQTILDVFMEVAGRQQGFGGWRHAPSILLLLTHIRQASERGITFFQRLKMEGSVNFCDLITEMLDAHNPSGERRRQLQQQQLHHLHHLPHHHLQQQQQHQQPQHSHGGPLPQHQHHQPPPPPQQHHQQQQQQALHTAQHQPPVHLHQPPPHARHQMAPE